MVSEFYHIISRVSLLAGFSFMVYESENDKLLRCKAGEFGEVPIPQALAVPLTDDNKIISFFSKNEVPVIAYFLRFNVQEGKRVVVISDTQARVHLNKFFGALSQCCIELEQEKDKISLRISACDKDDTPQGNIALLDSDNADIQAKDVLIHSLQEQLSKIQSNGSSENAELEIKLAEFNEIVRKKESETEELRSNLAEKNQQIDILSVDLCEMADLVKIVKKSRDKHCALVDGIFMPMYSISQDMKLIHGNRALAVFLGVQNISKIIGKQCYSTIFGFNAPCSWCKKHEVETNNAPSTIAATITKGGRACSLDVTGFPIIGQHGEFFEYGEFFEDKTDKVEMMSTINKFREQIVNFKRAKISEMNEVQDVRKAYDELSINYDLLVDRNKKMSRALETLMSQESTKDLIATRAELNEYKNKIARAADTIKNYQRNIDEMKEKYADLNKRIFFQMERLINTINSKYNPPVAELKASLEQLSADFEMSREFFMSETDKKLTPPENS